MLWRLVIFVETEATHNKAWKHLCEEVDDQRAILCYLYGTSRTSKLAGRCALEAIRFRIHPESVMTTVPSAGYRLAAAAGLESRSIVMFVVALSSTGLKAPDLVLSFLSSVEC